MANTKPLEGMPLLILSIALAVATFMMVLDYSIANVSIPYISGDLGVSNDQGTYVITSFAVGNAISLPITGWLTKQFGAVKLLVTALLLFVLFSWLCGISNTFEMLVTCRFLQGFVAGPMMPLSQTLIITSNPPEKKNAALALWSTVAIVGPILGPILGGWISFDYTWPWIFYINIPVGILSAVLIWFLLRDHETDIQREPLDWIGLIFLAVGVSCLQILLDKGEQYDWFDSYWMRFFGITSFVSFTALIVWSTHSKKPLLELRLFKIITYALSVLFIGIAYAIYFGSVVLVPLWLQENMGYDAIWAGLAVCPIGIAPLIFSKWTGKMISRWGKIKPLGICFTLFSISCFYTAYFDTDVSIQVIGFSRFLFGCGLVFFITPLFALSVQDLPHDKLPSGTGMFHFIRAMVGGIGTAVFTTLWIRRSAYHHQTVGENLTPFTQQWVMYRDQLEALGIKGKKALALTNEILDNQAAILSLNDCFFLMGWIFLGLILFLPLAQFQKRNPAAAQNVDLSSPE